MEEALLGASQFPKEEAEAQSDAAESAVELEVDPRQPVAFITTPHDTQAKLGGGPEYSMVTGAPGTTPSAGRSYFLHEVPSSPPSATVEQQEPSLHFQCFPARETG